MQYYVYLLTNWNHRVLYTGVTKDLQRRLYEHKYELVDGFTKRYHVHKLVYFETTTDVRAAIEREKQIKSWSRKAKNQLISDSNPDWNDLSENW
ncbi:MAG: GIY-YIG nuclease family protein [Oscillospiraceae bacterium]|nr:GIY-YIG nuclease family protein [Oscillospiraceae bacterium]